MFYTSKVLLLLISISFFLFGCKKTESKLVLKDIENGVKYANGFSIYENEDYTKLIIHRGYLGDKTSNEYYLFSKNANIPDSFKNKPVLKVPISKIVVTNTSHIPMLEAISEEHSLFGFPNTKYISSKNTRKLIEKGTIQDLGNEQAMNVELILDIKPDVLIGFWVDQPSKMYENISNLGIPVIMNSDWMEETPLGRAEWIKLFGVLYDKKNKADSIFQTIEIKYNKLKDLAQKSKTKPTVMCGSLFQDIWYMPAGKSFLAQMINDAHADYLWKDSESNGSLALNIETVFSKAQDADFWIAPGDFITFEQILKTHKLNLNFKSYKNRQIYTYAFKKNKFDGIMYFESSPLYPDRVLHDLIRIFHPEIIKDSTFYYYEKLK